MLILTRREMEGIRIGPDIAITILRIKGKSVSVGITAPGMKVMREELIDFDEQEPQETCDGN